MVEILALGKLGAGIFYVFSMAWLVTTYPLYDGDTYSKSIYVYGGLKVAGIWLLAWVSPRTYYTVLGTITLVIG